MSFEKEGHDDMPAPPGVSKPLRSRARRPRRRRFADGREGPAARPRAQA